MTEIMNFANALAGTLSFLGWTVISASGLAYLFNKEPRSHLIPAGMSDSAGKFKADRFVLLFAVGLLLFSEFVLDYRVIYGRFLNEWTSTQMIAVWGWLLKSVASLVIARQFSVIACGERGWLIMAVFGMAAGLLAVWFPHLILQVHL